MEWSDPDSTHWLPETLSAWWHGEIAPYELFTIYFMGFVTHTLGSVIIANRPQLARWPPRIGVVVFLVTLANLINLDEGFGSAVLRFVMSLGISWFAAGLVAIAIRPVTLIVSTLIIKPYRSWIKAVESSQSERAERRRERKLAREQAWEDARWQAEEAEEAAAQAEAARLKAEQDERERPTRELRMRLEAAAKERREAIELEQRERDEGYRKHRESVLFRCQSSFDRLRPQFPAGYEQDWLEAQFERYLSWGLTDQELVERADEILRTLEQLAHGRSTRSVAEVRERYEQARQDLKQSSLDPSDLEQHLAKLAAREAEAISEVLDNE